MQLDFGDDVFSSRALWLEIAVRPGGESGAFTTLLPRQELAAAPYAFFASLADSVPWSGMVNVPAGFADGVDNTRRHSEHGQR